jgi:uncharacterized paraquat-inducible protein A
MQTTFALIARCGIIDEMRDVTFFDLFDPKQPRSDQSLIEERLTVCNSCEWFDKRLARCKKCGCFMRMKSTLKQAECPIGKW